MSDEKVRAIEHSHDEVVWNLMADEMVISEARQHRDVGLERNERILQPGQRSEMAGDVAIIAHE